MKHTIDLIKGNSDNQPIGTKKAGYASPEDGPFKCSHCIHYKEVEEQDGRCNHPEVISDPDMKKDEDKKAIVKPGSCCNFFNPGDY